MAADTSRRGEAGGLTLPGGTGTGWVVRYELAGRPSGTVLHFLRGGGQ